MNRGLKGLSLLCAFICALSIVANSVATSYQAEIDGFLGTNSTVVVSTNDGTLASAFIPSEKYLNADGTGNSAALVQAHIDLNRKMSQEGSVLLKNENSALPLDKSEKITLLGIRSIQMLYGSSTSVTATASQIIPFDTILADRFDVNPTALAAYNKLNETIKLGPNDNVNNRNGLFDAKEPALESVIGADPDFEKSIDEYNDVAIVVISRPNTENDDYKPGETGVVKNSGAHTALALFDNEKEIIDYATENFKKVVVILNCNSAMEIDELKHNSKIDSILWVGFPGCYGALGIADILDGTVSPSGHLYDTYAANSLSSPAMMNMGDFTLANEDEVTRHMNTGGDAAAYIIEAEGIYVGYRYYETRYEDVVLNQGNASSTAGTYASSGAWNYSEEVSYGFGYGLSYTSFDQEIVDVKINKSAHSLTADVTVKVTNTGLVAGKDVVQVYGQAPYIQGGVEKSSIQLLNFDKTDTLKPGETQTLVVTVDFQNLASWDIDAKNGNGSYVLDAGDYYLSIGNGAHDALNNVLAAKGKTSADGMDYNGDASKTYRYDAITQRDEDTFNVTKANANVSNSLETADWNYFNNEEEVVYLSRSDWESTYPKTYDNLTASEELIKMLNGSLYQILDEVDADQKVIMNQLGALKYAFMKGRDYDDPEWENLLNQLDMKEALLFMYNGNRQFSSMDSIGFLTGSYTENGPNGIGGQFFRQLNWPMGTSSVLPWYISADDENAKFSMTVFPSAPVVASTFSPEIAYEQGELIGNDALFVGLPILWGPGLNTHRHPYNGRNGEYYSEDPILTGAIGMEYVMGALEHGLIASPKHFAFNDQETNRYGVAPYMTEQKARELDLRAFQIAFEATKYDEIKGKDVGMLGVMVSYSKIGAEECTASKGLLTDILRTEWGYNGYVVSDKGDDVDMFADCLIAGLTSFDGGRNTSYAEFETLTNKFPQTENIVERYSKDPALREAVKEAVHRDLYVLTQSNYMNQLNTSSYVRQNLTWWRASIYAVIGISGLTSLLCGVAYVFSNKRYGGI